MEKYKRVAIIGASVILILAAIYLFVKYALGIILPFLFAFLIAFISRPLVDRVCRKTRLNRSVVSVVIMFLLLFFNLKSLIFSFAKFFNLFTKKDCQ